MNTKKIQSLMEELERGNPLAVIVKQDLIEILDAILENEQTDQEVCICAAVISDSGKIYRGHRHRDCYSAMREEGDKMAIDDKEGFITSKNRFVGRMEGRKLQDLAGIKSAAPEGYQNGTLYSEDLY